jgi:putative glutathione S-transferase
MCLFTTLLRFAVVYYGSFECNVRRIADYPTIFASPPCAPMSR